MYTNIFTPYLSSIFLTAFRSTYGILYCVSLSLPLTLLLLHFLDLGYATRDTNSVNGRTLCTRIIIIRSPMLNNIVSWSTFDARGPYTFVTHGETIFWFSVRRRDENNKYYKETNNAIVRRLRIRLESNTPVYNIVARVILFNIHLFSLWIVFPGANPTQSSRTRALPRALAHGGHRTYIIFLLLNVFHPVVCWPTKWSPTV